MGAPWWSLAPVTRARGPRRTSESSPGCHATCGLRDSHLRNEGGLGGAARIPPGGGSTDAAKRGDRLAHGLRRRRTPQLREGVGGHHERVDEDEQGAGEGRAGWSVAVRIA